MSKIKSVPQNIQRLDDGTTHIIYGDKEKYFRNSRKKIYLPTEYDCAVRENLRGDDVIVLGANGYSLIKPEHLQRWGVQEGAYEAACFSILYHAVVHLQNSFPGVSVRIVHGSSNMGIDKALISLARRLNLSMLGHSCPEYMMYVEDDDVPVYVAPSVLEYSVSFCQSLDILIGMNGRKQAFDMDIDAAFKFHKHVIPINILRMISTTGGASSFDESGAIQDAIAAFYELIHVYADPIGFDSAVSWERVQEFVATQMKFISRRKMSPQRAFGISDRI